MMPARGTKLDAVLAALGDHKVTTSAALAAQVKVSERTIYRYINDLRAAGAPFRGEAGMGFQLRRRPEDPANG